MADNGNTIGRLNVEITGNAAPLQGALRQAETETTKTASKMNEALGAVGRGGTFDGISKGIKDSTAGVRNLLSAVVGVVGAFSRMLGLIGLVTSAVTALGYGAKRVYEYFSGTADEAERIQKNLQDAAAAYERYVDRIRSAAKNLPSPTPNLSVLESDQINKDDKRAKVLQDAIDAGKKARRITADWEAELTEIETRRQQRRDVAARAAEIERLNDAKSAAEAAAALEDKAQQDILAAIRKAREQRMSERKKEADELAEYQLQTALMVLNRQKEMDDERAANLIKNAKAVQSAFDAVLKSQRGAMDSNKLAIDIGRLAAAVEDIARSPRGAGNVIGGGW